MSNKGIPTGWKKVQFGNVVKKINDKVQNREEWTFERFIGGQHFDEGEIRITRSAPIEGNEEVIGSAFHMRFKPGQVLYVTRNPRLRKGGMVDFEGVCSNVSFVMEADEKQLLQSLLPFVIQTEDFVKHTCNNAHGSTNPFLNWKDIVSYEFLLPPIEEQKKISEVLWEIENSIKDNTRYKTKLNLLKDKLVSDFFKENKDLINLKEASMINKNSLSSKTPNDYEFSYLDISSIIETGIIGDLKTYKYVDAPSRARRIINYQDVVISTVRPYLKGFVFIHEKIPDLIGSTGFAVLSAKERTLPEYLWVFVLSKFFMRQAEQSMIGSNYPALNQKDIENFKIPKVNFDMQKAFVERILKIENSLSLIKENMTSNKNLRNKLSNELLKGELRLK